ncbi:MAG: sigma-70 family RNA polymerase sigma factor [Candidatus Xenobiia bacterium LiM19]
MSGSFEASLPFASQDSKGGIERELEKKERISILKGAISSLKPREKLILSLYYYEELTLKEIQQILGISMPRISQIHKSVLKKLKEFLRDKKEILITE